jgi:phytanoyl-CoA hydroxylase
MNTTLTAQRIESYRTNGFLALPDFLDAGELATWRRVTEEAVAQRLGNTQGLSNDGAGGFGDDYYRRVFTQCLRLADIHAGMRELIYDRRIAELVGTLAGVDGIRVWHDQALFKPPHGNPTSWHLDTPYWSFCSHDALSIWIALDDATLQNGCMCYLPGTHQTARFDNSPIGPNMSDLFKLYPEWKNITPVPVPLPAGGAAIHNGLCAHAAGANMTNKPRRAMTCAYMPDGCTFNGQRNILPKEMFERLKVGDRLDDAHQNPLLWTRTQ